MAAIAVSESIVRKLKVALRERLPFIQSSHLSEAIARGFGFNTNIAFHSFLERQHASTTCVFDAAMFEF